MEEHQATIDGTTYAMPEPFLVIATQNPIEYEGTFALPEAQLDRFMLRIRLGYPSPAEQQKILDQQKITTPWRISRRSCRRQTARAPKGGARDLRRSERGRLHRPSGQRHPHAPDVYLGASPRGSLALYRTGQALAALPGRDYVIPETSRLWPSPASLTA